MRTLRSALLGIVAVAGLLLTMPTAASAANATDLEASPSASHIDIQIPPLATNFQIVNVNSGMCATVSFGSHDTNTNIDQEPCRGPENRAQLWRIKTDSSPGDVIKNLNSLLCMTVSHASLDTNANIDQETCRGPSNRAQHWFYGLDSELGDQIVNANSLLCMTVSHGSLDANANIDQETCRGPSNRAQHWFYRIFD